MHLNIIHLPNRADRLQLLQSQIEQQNIIDYKIWPGIVNVNTPCTGISQAHKQIVQHAKENNLSEILIAEDDICFTAKGAFQYFLNNKPSKFDIYLGGIYNGVIKADNTVNDFAGLTIYMVHQHFYNAFLSMPENLHLDRALRNTGQFVVCNPMVAIQHNGFSDNTQKYCNYEPLLMDKKLFTDDLGYKKG